MSRYLVTGVCGFVGQYFCKLLKERESDLRIIGIDLSQTCPYDDECFEYYQLNLQSDSESILNLVTRFQPDYILNLAAISSVSQSWKNPSACLICNIGIYANLLEAVRLGCPAARILSISSSEVYGNQPDVIRSLNESSVLRPNNPYGISRVAQENLSTLYFDSYGMRIITARSFNHIGPGQKENFVIPSFVLQLMQMARQGSTGKIKTGNVEIIRDFLDVRDVVNAYYGLMKNGTDGETYNVCSGEGVRLKDIILYLSEIIGIDVVIEQTDMYIRPNDTLCCVGDNTKLKKTIGWSRDISFVKTLKDIIDYYK